MSSITMTENNQPSRCRLVATITNNILPMTNSRWPMRLGRLGAFCLTVAILCLDGRAMADDGAVKTELKKTADGWQLFRDGKPYFIKGGGGDGPMQVLVDCGGNSIRTWGVGNNTQELLDKAQKLGVTVTLGIWLGHKDNGFDYDNADALKKQLADARRAVERYKNHPALLMWALGNEMENGNDVPAVWNHVEDLAKMVHEVDPNHPTMSVVAEIGGDKVANIHKYCPSLDVVGINSYGGGPSVAERYRAAGGTKPIVITEFGPAGTWEIHANAFGAPIEQTSTAKAQAYRNSYEKSVLGAPGLCLGSYAFTWGFKIEATSTWYGMFLPDGSRLAAVDTMQELWSGKAPAHPCSAMTKLSLTTPDQVNAGDTVKAVVELADANDAKIDWQLFREQGNYGVQGTGAAATASYPEAIEKNGENEVTIKIPKAGGVYRIYCYVHNTTGGAAVGSLPVKVKGSKVAFRAPAVEVPFVVYADGMQNAPYIATGWMGDTKAVSMDAECTNNPHSGKTCLKVDFNQDKGWAGVIWQSPPNDWGLKPGGYDISAANRLTFWARGAKGGEKVKFGMGIIGIEKQFHDSGKKDTGDVRLTTDWKQYTIDLSDVDLQCIKSGFSWTLGGQGAPLTFYLDDIQYEGDAPAGTK
jgi:hypothetical protein